MATAKKTPAPSTAVAVKKPNSGSIVSIQEALKAQTASLANRTAPASGNTIRLSPNKFTLPDGTTTAGPLELVVVDFTSKNVFYENGYDAKNIVPPNCLQPPHNHAEGAGQHVVGMARLGQPVALKALKLLTNGVPKK